jgi:hypothetical protein
LFKTLDGQVQISDLGYVYIKIHGPHEGRIEKANAVLAQQGKTMSNKMSATRLRDQVYGQWISRTEDRRKHSDTESFIDELWSSGMRLGSSQSLHYQHVMDVIRFKISD